MYVCVCLAVTESEVREAVACGAKTREAVTRSCKAGGDCGACHSMINAILEETIGPLSSPALAVCPPPADSEEQLISETDLVRSARTPNRAA
jgi:bacterioferritin-associated ferredoxin